MFDTLVFTSWSNKNFLLQKNNFICGEIFIYPVEVRVTKFWLTPVKKDHSKIEPIFEQNIYLCFTFCLDWRVELTRTSQRWAVYSKWYNCHKSRSLPPSDRPTKSRHYVDKEQRKRKRPSSKFGNLIFRFNITLFTNLIWNRYHHQYR